MSIRRQQRLARNTWCATILVALEFVITRGFAGAQGPICPRPSLARLAGIVGRWRVAWRWGYGVDSDSTVVRRAVATISWGAGRCVLIEQLTGVLRGRPLAVAVMVTAPTNDSLQRTYVDSEHGTALVMNAEARGDTLRFAWGRDLGTRQLLVRHEYFGFTPAGFETRTLTSPNSGTDWVVVQRASYRRAPLDRP